MSDTVASASMKLVSNAVCTFCGCACDDIELEVHGLQITKAHHACPLGEAWYLNQAIPRTPIATIEGRPAEFNAAVRKAAEILSSAKYPLVYGLSNASSEAQRLAVALADRIGGNIDTTTSLRWRASVMAVQGVGEVTCSLGEIKNRADLIICWGSNPVESHPRHFSRYSVTPAGQFVARGRKDRTVVVVDVQHTATAQEADLFWRIKPRSDFEILWALRATLHEIDVDDVALEGAGVSRAMLVDLVERMKRAKFGVFLFGDGLSLTEGKQHNVEALLTLARDLNDFTCFAAVPMRGGENAVGADTVLCWQTGYPFGVNLTRGWPRFNPGEFTAADMLTRGEVDAALVVGADPASDFPVSARRQLAQIPLICLDSRSTPTNRQATVSFTTSTPGINSGGTVYRMDDVPLPLRPAYDSPFPDASTILQAIHVALRE